MFRIRHVLAFLLTGAVFLTIWLVFAESAISARYLLPAFLLATLLLLCLSLGYFAVAADAPTNRPQGWLQRLGQWFYRQFIYLLALAFTATSIVLGYILLSTGLRFLGVT